MIDALLRHKLSTEQENMEDILTSTVFGVFRYLPPQDGLLPFLARARTLDGQYPLGPLATIANDSIKVEYAFWPRWPSCEPDVVLTIKENGAPRWLIAVEAKYRSGKSSEADDSSEAPTDQLAREWCDVAGTAAQGGARPLLLYLTADVACPRHEVQATFDELRCKRSQEQPHIAWLSWHELSEPPFSAMHLGCLARRLGFLTFQGFAPLRAQSFRP